MPGRLITTQDQFNALCDRLRSAGTVAFDTEFVSEYHFRPKLCLLQFATRDEVAAVDPFEVPDLSRWWSLMTDDETTIVVHGSREEVRFCHYHAGAPPRRSIDVQIAEGLLSRGFPVSYKQLVQRAISRRLHDHETRTEWRRRPLTKEQVDYALDDVRYLLPVWDSQRAELQQRGRLDWAEAEFARFIDEVGRERERNDWRRLPGAFKLSRRGMAVARELYAWRERKAEEQDRPVRNVIRDDLLVEIAKRQPKSENDLFAVRGMQRRDYHRLGGELLAAVRAGLEVPDNDLPDKPRSFHLPDQTEVLGRILALALAHRCAELGVSTTLVGTASDLQDLVRWHVFEGRKGERPRLLQGWRAEVCGDVLTDLLEGRTSLRITNPRSEAPLHFEPVAKQS
jgi:ribonuclease D